MTIELNPALFERMIAVHRWLDKLSSALSVSNRRQTGRNALGVGPIFTFLAAIAVPASARSPSDDMGTETQSMAPMPPMAPATPASSTTARTQTVGCTPQQSPATDRCLAMATKPRSTLMVRINQFMLGSTTSGPRGQSRITGPGSSMVMYENDLSPRNTLRIDFMGSAEQVTVRKIGTPQLLQSENLDAMYAHDTIMALEFAIPPQLAAC